jgi:hypothetical protein
MLAISNVGKSAPPHCHSAEPWQTMAASTRQSKGVARASADHDREPKLYCHSTVLALAVDEEMYIPPLTYIMSPDGSYAAEWRNMLGTTDVLVTLSCVQQLASVNCHMSLNGQNMPDPPNITNDDCRVMTECEKRGSGQLAHG